MASQLIFNGLPGLPHWSEDFSDVTIYCGPEEFKFTLHSVILSASEYFTKTFSGQFSKMTNKMTEIFGRLVQFCYSGTYTESLSGLENANETQGNTESARSCFLTTYGEHSKDSKEINRWGGFGAVYLAPLEIANNHLYLSGLLGAAGPPMPKGKLQFHFTNHAYSKQNCSQLRAQ
ncbi:hypothetical protein M0657_010036 [Pyricularia oryzae]|nr:hypothetical protein M0657_010036 [Pyricularia oryzae]